MRKRLKGRLRRMKLKPGMWKWKRLIFLWKRKHFDERGWKRRRTRKQSFEKELKRMQFFQNQALSEFQPGYNRCGKCNNNNIIFRYITMNAKFPL